MDNKVICPVCKSEEEDHLIDHLKTAHKMDIASYIDAYTNCDFLSVEMRKTFDSFGIKRSVESTFTKTVVTFGDRPVDFPFKLVVDRDNVPNIDPYFIYPACLYDVMEGLKEGHVYIFGETGLGKTDSVYQLAALLNQPIKEINMTGETTPENFVGYLTAEKGSVYFHKGILLECMENGFWLLVDEIDYGNPKILSILNSVMQFGFVNIPETKERVYAHKSFRIIGTANTSGTGDETGFYAGTNLMNRALVDRFETAVEYDFPSEQVLREIILSRVGTFSSLDNLIKFVTEIRKAVQENQIYMPFGIRSAIKFAKKLKTNTYSSWDAAKLSFANMSDNTSKEVIRGLVQRVFGH